MLRISGLLFFFLPSISPFHFYLSFTGILRLVPNPSQRFAGARRQIYWLLVDATGQPVVRVLLARGGARFHHGCWQVRVPVWCSALPTNQKRRLAGTAPLSFTILISKVSADHFTWFLSVAFGMIIAWGEGDARLSPVSGTKSFGMRLLQSGQRRNVAIRG